jgi:hypothetical protein
MSLSTTLVSMMPDDVDDADDVTDADDGVDKNFGSM